MATHITRMMVGVFTSRYRIKATATPTQDRTTVSLSLLLSSESLMMILRIRRANDHTQQPETIPQSFNRTRVPMRSVGCPRPCR